MKTPIKAVLLSAFVMPGAGHIYLKRHIVAAVLIVVSLAAFSMLMSIALDKARLIADQILLGDVPPNLNAIMQMVSQASSNDNSLSATIATSTLIIAWVIGIVDSYRIAQLLEKRQ
ncbi:MAG: hypothetical protein KTR16_01055 [Acidiferrobacterales bacterium]|nr:hypothetical protein [Acidiferrobacterales bacterium]